eukprot:CAMPEP_0197312784 /NCGR_PEP_ID=MMETSP0891-20130614/23462_1 /TAXON_ID=44058 ORGANISM="Aureoumbra lagunensis, Strain CCMP1510" /NCGR_SAMPLE_ID=MMETSP0891 /ASSEMBLY_ACC=CAM_ASM_000534 /LENGTH=865 /DNA_ID=CAMNT_0042800209 /DNA_START=199 /DNA_END=2796 /DNA_ORIENTATION=-
MPPSKAWGVVEGPKPTGAWYMNLVVTDNDAFMPSVATPYAYGINQSKLMIGYGPAHRVLTAATITDNFELDLLIGFQSERKSKELLSADLLTATLGIESKNGGFIKARFARGSPYTTLEIMDIGKDKLILSSKNGIASISADEIGIEDGPASCSARVACFGLDGDCCPTTDGVRLNCCDAFDHSISGIYFTVVTVDGLKWRLYASSYIQFKHIGLPNAVGHYIGYEIHAAAGAFESEEHHKWRGVLRIAHIPDIAENGQNQGSRLAVDILDKHAYVYPIASNIEWSTMPDDELQAILDFHFAVKRIGKDDIDTPDQDLIQHQSHDFGEFIPKNKEHKKNTNHRSQYETARRDLLLLALPHHVAVLQVDPQIDIPIQKSPFTCVKGDLTYVKGSTWRMLEGLTAIEFSAPRRATPSMLNPTQSALKKDVLSLPPIGAFDEHKLAKLTSSYGSGKRATQLALLALACNSLNLIDEAKKAAETTLRALNPWLDPDYISSLLVYDKSYGGIVTKTGLENIQADFGQGWYNDHHFHYGYHLFAAACVLHILGPHSLTSTQKAALAAMLGDVATEIPKTIPGKRTIRRGNAPNQNYFPVARHKDFYEGHSWASGLFEMPMGKNQESSSEATHCYYGVSLLGVATNDYELRDWGRLLLAMEMRAARYYWHVSGFNRYPEPFGSNVVVSIIGGNLLSSQTFFGTNKLFAILVNSMPFTPISEDLLTPPRYIHKCVEQAVAELPSLHDDDDPALSSWRALLLQLVAITDPTQAFSVIIALSMANPPPQLDQTQSIGSMLYWVATRPDPGFLNFFDDDTYTDYAPSHAPTTASRRAEMGEPMCAAHDRCLKYGLNNGNCCPTEANVMLWCCHALQ